MSRLKSCFISLPFGVDTAPLIAELESRGIKPVGSLDVVLGTSLSKTIVRDMTKADFCIAILTTTPTPNAFIDIGIALGLGRPLALIVDPDLQIPSDLAGFNYVRASLDNTEAISHYIDAFLDHHTGSPDRGSKPLAPHRLAQADYEHAIQRIATAQGAHLEAAVADLFTQAGSVLSGCFCDHDT